MLLFTKLFFFCVGCVAYLLFLGLRLVTVSPGYFLCYWFSSPQLLPGVKLTVGSNSDPAVQALCAMGAQHVAKSVTEALVDEENKVVSTPAYMCEAPLHQIFDGIGCMIAAVIKLVKSC